jgi:pyruvate dehydrogenase E1 component alpha subunit
MLLIRRFDERLLSLQKQGLIPGHTSPYIGQEAIAVGVAAELAEGDFVASHHRPTGHALMAGLNPGRVLAELLGRVGGYCRGKAGKHQLTSLEHGFLGANGVGWLAVGSLSPSERRSGKSCAGQMASQSPISATAQQIRGLSTKQ